MEFEVLRNVLQEEKLEEILVANWTRFLDSSRLMALVLNKVKENENKLSFISGTDIKQKGVSITISRFYLTTRGFNLWVDFHIPLGPEQMAEGTMELNLGHNGSISHINTVGNIFSKF